MSEAIHGEVAAERSPARPLRPFSGRWMAWAPLVVFPLVVMVWRATLLPWVFMWLLAAAIFAGCKWQTWWEARSSGMAAGNWRRSLAYLLLWPGMEPREFFAIAGKKHRVASNAWFAAVGRTLLGIALLWSGTRMVQGHPLLAGWTGMLGLVLFLHFGTFHLLALAWQCAGIPVQPIMHRPLASTSLSELWGRRWNLGFRKLSHAWVFQPLEKRFGLAAGTLGAFLLSGLLHDLVISVPARAGYGLPTAYFLTQGLGVIVERSEAGKRLGLGCGWRGWLWTAAVAVGPLAALFHPWFVERVIVPFLGELS